MHISHLPNNQISVITTKEFTLPRSIINSTNGTRQRTRTKVPRNLIL